MGISIKGKSVSELYKRLRCKSGYNDLIQINSDDTTTEQVYTMKNEKLHAIVLSILICAMLIGCGRSSSGERSKSGELMLNSVESAGGLNYIAHGMELEETPSVVSQVIPFEDGFLLLGEQMGQQLLTVYDPEGKIINRYDMGWLQENQYFLDIQAGADDSIYALVCTEIGKDNFSYDLYAIDAEGAVKPAFHLPVENGRDIRDMVLNHDTLYFSLGAGAANRSILEGYSRQGEKETSVEVDASFSLVSSGSWVFLGVFKVDGLSLLRLDPETGSLEELETFTEGQLIAAAGDKVYLKNSSDVFCYDCASGETTYLFQWAGNGGVPSSKLCPLTDGSFIIWNGDGLRLLQAADPSKGEVQEIVLALNGYPLDLSNVIMHFNDENRDYRITVKDYSAYQDPILMLSTEINSGNAPDIIDTAAFSNQILKEGALEDLLPYFEADADISTSDLLQAPFNAMLNKNGKLLGISPSFLIWTLVGGRSEPALQEGTVTERLRALGDPESTFAGTLSRDTFLALAFCCGNTETYSEEDITAILEFAYLLPNTEEGNAGKNVSEGRQRLLALTCSHNIFWRDYREYFGGNAGDMNIVGLPFIQGTGIVVPSCRLAIPTSAENKEGAWAFLKYMLLSEYDAYLESPYCPILKAEYERLVEHDVEKIDAGELMINEEYITEKSYISEFDQLLNGVCGMYDMGAPEYEIVRSGAEPFFSGYQTANQVAANIYSRLSIYFAEQR